MIQISMKKKYTILSENEELELISKGDFVIKRALAENYEIIDFHCHSYECLFQLFPLFLQKKKSDFNKSLMDLSCFPFSIDLFDLNKIYFSKCPTKLFSLAGLRTKIKLFTGVFVLNYATTERLLKDMDNNCISKAVIQQINPPNKNSADIMEEIVTQIERLYTFGAIHPFDENIDSKITRKSIFAKGIKTSYNRRMGKQKIVEYFEEVEASREYSGYFCSIPEAISIVVLGSMCGLRNISQIHQWAESDKVSEFLKEEFGIEHIPCYYWLLSLLKLIKPESLNKCLMKWAESILPKERKGLTISLDGKTVRSTCKMKSYDSPLHIISAQISELGITFASKSVEGKSNEIPAVQQLIGELSIQECMVVADALNCQRETAETIVRGKGDYLLDAKGNQPVLEREIREYVQDESLRKTMDRKSVTEKSRDRIETRTAYTTTDVGWLWGKEKWKNLCCIGAIKTEFERKGTKTEEWHYYISSRDLTALELLHHARMEWAVESMHWILDVHFSEDFCRIVNRTIQQNLNMLRKFALSLMKQFKTASNSKRPLSQIMFNCLLDPSVISHILEN